MRRLFGGQVVVLSRDSYYNTAFSDDVATHGVFAGAHDLPVCHGRLLAEAKMR